MSEIRGRLATVSDAVVVAGLLVAFNRDTPLRPVPPRQSGCARIREAIAAAIDEGMPEKASPVPLSTGVPCCNRFCYIMTTMAANSRLTIAVHALTWLARAQQQGHDRLTSDQVAASVNTNPVIIRRCLGDLRQAGLVLVRRGPEAGWSMARRPDDITVLEVYDAVAPEPLFAMHHTGP